MSTYIISDIHGDSRNLKRLLDMAAFNPEVDQLYINGDIIDRGKNSLKLLQEIMALKTNYPDNIWIIKGNHELFLQCYVENRLGGELWSAFGGADTLKEFEKLDEISRCGIYEFIKELPLYYRIMHPKYGKCIITHSGLLADVIVRDQNDKIDVEGSIIKAADYDEYKLLISGDIHTMPTVQLSEFLIVGHVPTIFLDNETYEILRKRNLLCIDSGAGYRKRGGKLSLYRLDDDMVYYS